MIFKQKFDRLDFSQYSRVIIKNLIFLILFPYNGFCQYNGLNYNKLISHLDSLLYIRNDSAAFLKKVSELPDSIFLEGHLQTVVEVAYARNDFEKFKKYARLDIEQGQKISTYGWLLGQKLTSSTLDSLNAWDYECRRKFLRKVPQGLMESISEMAVVDAKFREMHYKGLIPFSIVQKNDSLNILIIKSIIRKYGMISERKYGALFHQFFYVILHCFQADIVSFNFMKNLLFDESKKGNINPYNYTYFVDRFSYLNFGYQVYGHLDPKGKIDNVQEVDRKRRELGISTINNWNKIKQGHTTHPLATKRALFNENY